jgi:hypothetical protein
MIMIYAQIKSGLKLHLAYEAGEGKSDTELVKAGYLSPPICGQSLNEGGYRMNINMPLGNACKRCLKVFASRQQHTQ